jgi:hypothetical protein
MQRLINSDFRNGLFELDSNVCGAFFQACDWLGIPANTFLIEESAEKQQ